MSDRLLLLALLPVLSLVGCFSSGPDKDCGKPQEYQAAGSVPDVVVPQGLVPVEGSTSFAIPAGPQAAGGPLTSKCLDRPPDYFQKNPGTGAGDKPASPPADLPTP